MDQKWGAPHGGGSTDSSSFGPDNELLRTRNSCNTVERYLSDKTGNRLAQIDTLNSGSYDGPKTILSYTASNQLFFSMTRTAQVGSYDYNWHWYDAAGRRMISQRQLGTSWVPISGPPTSGQRTFYVYDGSDVALAIVKSGSSWWVKARYLTGGVDQSHAGRFRNAAGSTVRNLALVNDRQGSTLAALRDDGSQEPDAKYFSRDAFGGSVGASGTGGDMNTETGFAGASTPNSSGGFVYLRNRWYDPQTGRFLTQDPIGLAGGTNLYAYAGNNPIAYSDPFGLCCDPVSRVLSLMNQTRNALGGLATGASNVAAAFKRSGQAAVQAFSCGTQVGQGCAVPPGMAPFALAGAIMSAMGTARGVGGSSTAMGTRYMGSAEAATVAETRSIPALNAGGQPRVIHYTTDPAMSSASAAQARYNMPSTPTHACQFPLCNVQNQVAPTGTVAPGATQAATSLPINGAGRPVPLEP